MSSAKPLRKFLQMGWIPIDCVMYSTREDGTPTKGGCQGLWR
jgi:hypothetical protein